MRAYSRQMGALARFRPAEKVFRRMLSPPAAYLPPVACACGMALAFYPGPAFFRLCATIALVCSSAGIVLRNCRGGNAGLRGRLVLFFAGGCVFGAGLALDEAALSRDPLAAQAGTSAGAAVGSVATGRDPASPVFVTAVSGRAVSDPLSVAGGGLSFPLGVQTVEYSGKTARGSIRFASPSVRLRVVADARSAVESGGEYRISGDPRPGRRALGGRAESVLFAGARDLSRTKTPGPLVRLRSSVREACFGAVRNAGADSSGLLQALLLGMMGDLDAAESAAFKEAGCAHILSLSGQHLSILAALTLACLKPLFGGRRARIGAMFFTIAFVWVAGPGPALLRSVLMVVIAETAKSLDRPQKSVNVLSLAFIVAISADPASARSLSFVLSYLALAGLAVLSPRFVYLFGRRLPPFIASALSAGCAAQAATAPVVAVSFGSLVPAGIFASMLAGPLVVALMWWGIGAAILCSAFPFTAAAARPVTDIIYRLLMAVMTTAAKFPSLSLPTPLSKVAACAVVVLTAAFVYALPHADSRIRCPVLAQKPPRGRRPGDVQEVRAEFSGQPPPA